MRGRRGDGAGGHDPRDPSPPLPEVPAGGERGSELYAIGAAAGGYDPKALAASSGKSVVDYLAAGAAKACTTSNPGGCGELIQAVVAAGGHSPRQAARNLAACT